MHQTDILPQNLHDNYYYPNPTYSIIGTWTRNPNPLTGLLVNWSLRGSFHLLPSFPLCTALVGESTPQVAARKHHTYIDKYNYNYSSQMYFVICLPSFEALTPCEIPVSISCSMFCLHLLLPLLFLLSFILTLNP